MVHLLYSINNSMRNELISLRSRENRRRRERKTENSQGDRRIRTADSNHEGIGHPISISLDSQGLFIVP